MNQRNVGGDSNLRGRGGADPLTRREFLLASAGAGAGLFVLGTGGGRPRVASAQAAPLGNLDVFSKGHPHAFYGRHVEGAVRSGDLTYEEFENKYLPLDGVLGKVLNEAHYYTGRPNLEYFKRFKERNPEKLVLLHYNGTGRRATDEALTRFFDGHFLYYAGAHLSRPVSNRTQKEIEVTDTSVFDTRRYRRGLPDDIAIARPGPGRKPDWSTAEHVRLERINARDKSITVRRGLYGSRKSTFARGAYIAAHGTTGPYRYNSSPKNNIPLWMYNFSSTCPKDSRGRTCGDALAEYLAGKLGPGGELETFDGIVFDVFSWVIRFGFPRDKIDVNADGRGDGGNIAGENVVSKGALAFLQKLREELGPNKLIVSDGHIPRESQRGFQVLNGIESEGYPDKYDFALDHLSRGENIFNYWNETSAPPSFHYANFRYKQRKPTVIRNTFKEPNLSQDKSYRKLRLALASTLFTDGAFTGSGGDLEGGGDGDGWLPPEVIWRATGARVRIFDELCKGRAQETHWLGQPMPGERGRTKYLAAEAADIFNGDGETWPQAFVNRFSGEGVAFTKAGTDAVPNLTIRDTQATRPPSMVFALPGVNVAGDDDLFVTLRLEGDPLEDYPTTVPRRVDVYAVPEGEGLNAANKEFTWVGPDPFDATLYFQRVGPGRVTLRFEVEGEQRVFFQKLTAHAAQNVSYREYENGIVFANASTRSYTFDVGSLFPEVTLRRLLRSDGQDPHDQVNDGNLVGDNVTLQAKDGLFVVKETSP